MSLQMVKLLDGYMVNLNFDESHFKLVTAFVYNAPTTVPSGTPRPVQASHPFLAV
jgi:hypothetical protein